MRPLSILLALAHTVGCAVAAFLMHFIATFPWENRDLVRPDGWLVPAAALLLVLAVATLAAVVCSRRTAAGRLFAAQATLAGGVLAFALSHSDHSDGRLIVFALAVEVAGLAGITLLPARASFPGDRNS
jgi:ABC-type transport system involved in cytochrome c biogenesis permease subunit